MPNLARQTCSPFDSIRHVDESGSEYWMARELMSKMGYNTWRRFENSIDRAIVSCQNSTGDSESHIAGGDNVVERPQGGGSSASDYKLSRFGAYMIAMNGDPRKPEVAAAQAYFAVKTREAELQRSPKSQLETLRDAVDLLIEQERRQAEQERKLALLERSKQEQDQRIDGVEAELGRYREPCGHWYTVLGFANLHGIKLSLGETTSLGRRAAALCRQQKLKVKPVSDPRWGRVGSYPESVLKQVFEVVS